MIKPHVLAVTLKVNILNSLIKSTQCGRKDKVQIKESLQTQGHRQTEIENCIPERGICKRKGGWPYLHHMKQTLTQKNYKTQKTLHDGR